MKSGFKGLQLVVLVTAVMVVVGLAAAWSKGRDFWSSPDCRAQRVFQAGDPETAATLFADPNRQGIAQFRAGEFKAAASTFAGLPGPDALFNQATARVMLGEYDRAVALYDQVLDLSPGRTDATTNRAIAAGRAERVKDEGGEMTGGKLGADKIVFSNTPTKSDGGDEVEVEEKTLSDEELRTMWLRQVQTTPGDFLRTKFAFQDAMQADVPEVSDDR
ncbi:hypothetical protein SAMN06265222_101805 [Neorhodopirellula lusitana]|uniref:Tetratricopeptide repeat protein n=1 Tax=Neorhodopirellula lusitana TaxID=445327 RepID=A0ABY1PQS5_9BACT|nr:tetratricopeptide repeat protein [Neorhodopirellula lusitana]SMP42572.1 hypothetical protein SAMN06265222_101805 [Neorhodopirellula lusitana]